MSLRDAIEQTRLYSNFQIKSYKENKNYFNIK